MFAANAEISPEQKNRIFELRTRLNETEEKLKAYEIREKAIAEALTEAERIAEKTVADARADAARIISAAMEKRAAILSLGKEIDGVEKVCRGILELISKTSVT